MPPHDAAAGSGWTRLLLVLVSRAYRAMLLTLTVVAAAPLAAGWGSYVVASASMQPSMAPGDVVLGRPTATDHRVRVGRVYVFDDPARAGRLLVHRVVERRDDGDYTTAGDANDVTDIAPLEPAAIRAQAILLVPLVGLPVHWGRTRDWLPLLLWILASSAAFVLAGQRLDTQRPPRPGRSRTAVATAVAVGAVAAGTAGSAGATFTDRTTASGSEWTAGAWTQPYVGAVLADSPRFLWLLDEKAGTTTAQDRSGNAFLGDYRSAAGLGQPGALPNNPGTSMSTSGGLALTSAYTAGSPGTHSMELWFRVAPRSAGPLIGFGSSTTAGAPPQEDRVVRLTSSGQITYGDWDSNPRSIITTPGAYDDGAWHHLVVVSAAANGGRQSTVIYVDGVARASGLTSKVGDYSSHVRIGGGSGTVTSTGSVDNVAVYHSALSASRVAAHWAAR
ncbi:signal peptidase I [Nocardioides eburneiflavus]|uniref:Signal peptidase I n=1 Tax=Nocardioides eburneiflavus TaxID=2518372 RepID=A0A4Z1CN27_9ACTN|nr:signal peptidase I [Nocardioides eburneiflavus]TGN66372.1 signal peptidase I [Nocardioides eburneiflavus]